MGRTRRHSASAPPLPPKKPWQEYWRSFIRTSEVGIVFALGLTAISMGGDIIIARCLFAAAVIVSVVSIMAESTLSKKTKIGASLSASLTIIAIGFVVIIHSRKSDTEAVPDVALRFVFPRSPALQIMNQSGKVAKNIKWTPILLNLNNPAHQLLQIPASTFDFIMAHGLSVPITIFNRPLVAPYVKKGDHLVGSVGISCPECGRGHTYVFSIIYGEKGWYSERVEETTGSMIMPKNMTKIIDYAEEVNRTPLESRIDITDP